MYTFFRSRQKLFIICKKCSHLHVRIPKDDDFADDVSEHAKGDTPPPERHLSLATKVRALRQAVSKGKEWREKIALKVRPSNSGAKQADEDNKGKAGGGEDGHNTPAEIVAEEEVVAKEKTVVEGQLSVVVHNE